MDVDLERLVQAGQLVQRQSVFMDHAQGYLQTHASLGTGELGVVLGFLAPVNLAVVALGAQVARGAGTVLTAGATAIADTAEQYVQAERLAYEELAEILRRLDVTVPPFVDPRGDIPALGPAAGGPPDRYGDGEPDIFSQAWDEGTDLCAYLDELPGRVRDRVGELTGGSAGVQERQDACAYLVPPVGRTSEIENMRWSAGVLIGGVDWVFEKLIGWSFLEEVIFKPFAGDWTAIHRASLAWEYVGDGVFAVGENLAALPEQTRGWEGAASEAFRAASAAMSAAMLGLSTATGSVSGAVDGVALASTLAAAGIGAVLRWLSTKLLRMAAEACVPVAGWAVDALEGAAAVIEIVAKLKLIYTLVNAIYDAIHDVIDAKEQLVDTIFVVEDLATYLGSSTVRALV